MVHIEAIRDIEGLELVGVADTDPEALARATAATGVPGFASTQELIDAVGPDAVHVTTPHHQHIGPSLTALEAGVHVLQEKPLAHTLDEGRRLVDALARIPAGGPKVGICFQNRYNLASRRLHEMLGSGELGAVRGAWASVVWTRSAEYYRAKPWRGTWEGSGGGLLINQAIHTLDLVQWLLGGVERTDGHVATRKYADVIEVEDTADLLLHHPAASPLLLRHPHRAAAPPGGDRAGLRERLRHPARRHRRRAHHPLGRRAGGNPRRTLGDLRRTLLPRLPRAADPRLPRADRGSGAVLIGSGRGDGVAGDPQGGLSG